jgi:predicted outer membrane repeat protein
MSFLAGAGLLSGYIPYVRPVAASTMCERTIELADDTPPADIESQAALALSDCVSASTFILNFVRADGADEDVKVFLQSDQSSNFNIDLYLSNYKTTLNFGDGITFSAQQYDTLPEYETYIYSGYDYYGNYYYSSNTVLVGSYRDYENTALSYGFNIYADPTRASRLEINGLELEWSDGIAINSIGEVTVANGSMRDNSAGGSALAVSAIGGANLVLQRTQFLRNGQEGGSGSALEVYGSASVYLSTFGMNSADYGGGINVTPGAEKTGLRIQDSNFYQNLATDKGGAIYAAADSVEILGSSLISNYAEKGGGVYVKAESIDIVGSNMDYNVAYAAGGAVYAGYTFLSPSNIQVSESSFAGNEAEEGIGGAIGGVQFNETVFESSTFIQNTQNSSSSTFDGGGAIGVRDFQSLSVRNSTFIGNQKTGAAGYTAGGAVFASYAPGDSPSVDFVSNTFIDNFSTTLFGPLGPRFEGASIHLFSYLPDGVSESPFLFVGNIFSTNSSLLAASGPGALMVGSYDVGSFTDGQDNDPANGISTPVEAMFNISDDGKLAFSSDTNRDDVSIDQLELGSLTNQSGKPKSRSIRFGSTADNFVQKSTLSPAAALLLPEFDQQGTRRGASVMDAGAFEFTGGGGGGGGSFLGAPGAKTSFLSAFKFDSPKLSLRQKRQIRAEFAANPLTTTVACKPFVTKAQKVAERKAARLAAKVACDYIQKRYPTVFVRVEPLGIVPKTDPKSRRVQISLG